MSDPKELAARLRKHAHGCVEWRVQDPNGFYCMAFDRSDSLNPEQAARDWLAEFRAKHPDHPHARYEVQRVHWYSSLEQAALETAAFLEEIARQASDRGGER